MPGVAFGKPLYVNCCCGGAQICVCNRLLGAAPTLTFYSNNEPATIHQITLSYSLDISDVGITCNPLSPPCEGYIGRFDGIIAQPMGNYANEGIDFRLICSSLDCSGYCLFFRYDSHTSGNWCRVSASAIDCTCLATILYDVEGSTAIPCDDNPGSYQIPEWLIEEDPTNCTP